MSRKRELQWYKPRKCWRKKYKGKAYYLAKGKGPDDRQSYEAALLEWLQKKAELDGKPQQPSRKTESLTETDTSVPFASLYDHLPDEIPSSTRTAKDWTIAEVMQAYLDSRRKEAEGKRRTVWTYGGAMSKLHDFLGFAARFKKVWMSEIDAHFVRHYRETTLSLPPIRLKDGTAGRPIGKHTARKRLFYFKHWLEWAEENEYIPRLPKNLNRKFCRIEGMPDPTPTTFTVEEVQELFKYASQRCKLYLCLGLNCGYGPTDIATLRQEDVDWDEWEIHRSRTKTGAPSHHSLWHVTMELLLRERNTKSKLVLVDEDGKPLQNDKFEGAVGRTTPIVQSFYRARTRADKHRVKEKLPRRWNAPNRGIKILRKTGAQWLEDHFPETPHIVKQYLGHKERDVVRHYRKESYKLLFEALDAMEKHFDLFDLL